jgi:hypothetical protein
MPMEKDYLILKPASASRPSGEWNDDDFDVLANGEVVGRIFKADVSVARPWMWTFITRPLAQPDLPKTNQAGCGVSFLSECGVRPPRKRAIGS